MEGRGKAVQLGDLDVSGELTIIGVNSGLESEATDAPVTLIDAQGIDRIFWVDSGATLTLRNLALTGGDALDHSGGAVLNRGNVRGEQHRRRG